MGQVPAGSLNRRVTIQHKQGSQDAWGQPQDVWVDVCTVWANVRTVMGSSFIANEMATGGTEVSRTTASIRIRRRSDIEHGMRVVLGNRIYDIRAVLPDTQGNEYVDLACAYGASEG